MPFISYKQYHIKNLKFCSSDALSVESIRHDNCVFNSAENRAIIFAKFVITMKFRFLNKTIENQRFDYTPRYYDERKQRLERKKALYKQLDEGTISDEKRREMFRENIQEGFSRSQVRQSAQKSSNMRILILIALMLALGYFIFNGVDDVDTVVTKMW